MSTGKTIRMFLVDGSPTGLLTAEIMNWSGHSLIAPRSRLPEAIKRSEMARTGVYLLIGDDPENPIKTRLYIGEADDVATRLRSHEKDESKDFWDRVCVFTSKDANLTKAHVRYLESRLITLAREADRATVANATEPTPSRLPESDVADMEYFLSQIQVVLPVVGIDGLRPKPKVRAVPPPTFEVDASAESNGVELVLTVARHGYTAHAVERDGEITVLAGSTTLANPQHSANSYESHRNALINSDALRPSTHDSKYLEFSEDVTFRSPSAAASVINGRNSNGRLEWVVEATGQTLKEYQEAQLPEISDEVLDQLLGK